MTSVTTGSFSWKAKENALDVLNPGTKIDKWRPRIRKNRDLKQGDDDGSENVGEKNDFAFFQTYTRLFGPSQYVKCGRLFLELNC